MPKITTSVKARVGKVGRDIIEQGKYPHLSGGPPSKATRKLVLNTVCSSSYWKTKHAEPAGSLFSYLKYGGYNFAKTA
ncbi:hypothetical protein SCP_1402530 [Sparassis crispa]|uniref:Uncharacterized protein n=1 Tax=Sparassis crispa TaxID=139825 RepID=A0A401H324_9APHY|nr:hypothetical protein SCP_1402530 [Sparassis crispa]GBE88845.1 hypothetical protein SCP_1402530 [Sparassis crispa]